jgi:hypothetical protein
VTSEGFTCKITWDGVTVRAYGADADIDADGANGQHGEKEAYNDTDTGSEYLANGGMGLKNGQVVFTESWGSDIAVTGPDGNPLVIDHIVVCKTAYRIPGFPLDHPACYIDSQTVPYGVVNSSIINGVAPIVMGCAFRVRYCQGPWIPGMVADVGPSKKIGEVSIAMANLLGLPSSPRDGGTNSPHLDYELFPGVPSGFTETLTIDLPLQKS